VAQTTSSATGLGQAWPNATDVSRSARWHTYTFESNGIKYIQLNDLNGNVRAAVGIANGAAFALPMGVDAGHVTIHSGATPGDNAQTVYSDDSMAIAVAPQQDGSTLISVMAMNKCPDDPYNCGGGRMLMQ
jgi:hypothetical protein